MVCGVRAGGDELAIPRPPPDPDCAIHESRRPTVAASFSRRSPSRPEDVRAVFAPAISRRAGSIALGRRPARVRARARSVQPRQQHDGFPRLARTTRP